MEVKSERSLFFFSEIYRARWSRTLGDKPWILGFKFGGKGPMHAVLTIHHII